MKKLLIVSALATAMGGVWAADYTTDVVVIGSGGAGLSAAVTLHDAGKKVIVLEKMAMVGGNTLRAEGGFNAAETAQQKRDGIPDTIEQFIADTMKGGHNINDPERSARTPRTRSPGSCPSAATSTWWAARAAPSTTAPTVRTTVRPSVPK